MIEVKNITKSFDEVQVLKGISSQFEKGKINAIIGRSGSGKTVFLKCLLGLMQPTSGEIFFEGIDIFSLDFDERKKMRADIGMVFQYSALLDFMNVEDNVRFPLDLFTNMSNKEKQKRVDQVLDRVDLVGSHKKFPSEISGGMKKRVGIARAIVNNPKYLFCDEPNSGLDPKTALRIDVLIEEITKEYNTTTIVNTHDMNSVLEIAEKILYLNKGLNAWEGSRKEILYVENPDLEDFVFSSKLFKQARKTLIMNDENQDF